MSNPYQVVRDFESALCEYTGAPFAVTTNSCTAALLLAVAWHLRAAPGLPGDPAWREVNIPRRTYISVPMSIIHAGGRPTFRDEEWRGGYQLKPLQVWDCARYFTSGMYRGTRPFTFTHQIFDHSLTTVDLKTDCAGQMVCLSFHAAKTLGDTQGGAILLDDPEAAAWLRRARFDGRTEGVAPKDDTFTQIGYHCYMSPDVAARLLFKLHSLPRNNDPLPNDDYPSLDKLEIFK